MTKTAHEDQKDYRFTSDWHSPAIPSWKRALAPYVDRPDLHYLEVGLFQGRSFFWILDNVATHPSSRLTGVDIDLKYIQANLEISGAQDRIDLIEGPSQEVLRTLSLDGYDIIYIDGSHRGSDVLVDAVLAWGLLKAGGTLIFDDYMWFARPMRFNKLVLPAELRPKEAIDTFTTLFRDELDVLHRGHQLILRKKAALCAVATAIDYCSPVGDYVYDWKAKEVRDPRTGAALALTEAERSLLEQLIFGIELGEAKVSAPPRLRADPDYLSLKQKLALEPSP